MPAQIIHMVEEDPVSVPKEDLDEVVVRELYRAHGSRLEIQFPNPLNPNCYVLHSKGYVGHIPVGSDLLFRIEPKLPIANLFRMLEYAYGLKSFQLFEGITGLEAIDDLFERLASILAKRVLDRARKGLYRAYERRDEPLTYVRGRLDLMATLRGNLAGSTQLHCRFEELTLDLEDNQILAWTLYHLPRLPLTREEVRREVRQAYRALAPVVSLAPFEPQQCTGRFYHRLNQDYQPLHGLCRFFLEHTGPAVGEGNHEFIPFLLNMPSLFESFVSQWLKQHLPHRFGITAQYRHRLDQRGSFVFKIDLVLTDRHTGNALAVMDTKYKRSFRPDESDIEQVVAYAAGLRVRNAVLIYPSARTSSIDLEVGDVRVRSLPFELAGDLEAGGQVFLNALCEQLPILVT